MQHIFFAYCPLSYDGDFFPEAPPGCALTPLFPATPGLILSICHIIDQLQFDANFESVRPYLVSQRLHHLLHSALRWPPALALARLRAAAWEADHLGLDPFEARLTPLLKQCLERQNRVPAQLLMARTMAEGLERGEYYWVLQGNERSRWVRWVSPDFRLCEGPPEFFQWPEPEPPLREPVPAAVRPPLPKPSGERPPLAPPPPLGDT
jgi:hypothetical protein